MNKIILIKHSLPIIEPDKPPHTWNLSKEGQERCLALVDRLKPYQPRKIFCSNEDKAIETARIMAEALNLPAEVIPGLHEHRRRPEEFWDVERFQAAVAELFACPEELVFGEETGEQAYQRFSAVIEHLVSRSDPDKPEPLAVVAHGTVISLFAARKGGVDPFQLWKRLGLPSYVVLSLPGFSLEEIVDKVV